MSGHQVALHTAPRLPLQGQGVWGHLPEEAGLLGLLQLPSAQEGVGYTSSEPGVLTPGITSKPIP